MEAGSVRRWVVLFLGILIAILIADAVSSGIVILAGVKGVAAYIINFVLYATILFGALFSLRRYGHIDIFNFDRD
ncbi:MAG: hypothetical protein LUO98_08820 [Methanoregula sp.]|nr:hypothetical protein [Methanoregula sp.]